MCNWNPNQEAKVEILDDSCQTKPEINYPCQWGYKIIGRDTEALKACISGVMGDKEHLVAPGNVSKTGKFHTFNISCEVEDEEERNRLFQAFGEHDAVKMVI
jgi:putative lipoic acid-binding regulatory protein